MASRKKPARPRPAALAVINSNCAGVDIGATRHLVCGPARDDAVANVRDFGTTTVELDALVTWLVAEGVTSIAMESTSVYWIPLYELLDSRGIEPVLVDARQVRNVPGRKSDVLDCQWIQLLHSRGLFRGSFRPADAICRLRAYQRQMGNLVAERSKYVQWMQKALDQMNVQVHRAVTDLTGKTGMSIVRAIVAGERDPAALAQLRDHRCKHSAAEIAEYLTGTWRAEHVFNLKSALEMYDMIEGQIAAYEKRILDEVAALSPPERLTEDAPPHPNPKKARVIQRDGSGTMRTMLWRLSGTDLSRIDGINLATAQTILTEIGLDLSPFPTEKHFVSWLRLCPRLAISGGKPLTKRKNAVGSTRVAGALRMAAVSLNRSQTALGALYRRMARKKGASIAVFATARRMAQLVYRMLRFGQDYVDIGVAAFEARFAEQRLAGIKHTANDLGYDLVQRPVPG